jgi:cysteine synthase A
MSFNAPLTSIAKHLTEVDKYRYDEAWERSPAELVPEFYHQLPSFTLENATTGNLGPDGVILDFRQPADFAAKHLPGAVNIPLETLEPLNCSPFEDSKLLARQWRELEALFSQSICGASDAVANVRKGKHVLTLCYHGDTSRIANSVLRAKGVQSVSCRGGFQAVIDWLELATRLPDSPPLDHVKMPNDIQVEVIAEGVIV